MQPYSDYEIAQRRIADRQQKRNYFYMALVLLALPVFVALFSRDISVKQCMIPMVAITGIFAITTGIQWYYSSPEHAPSEMEIQQELEWLFGENPEDLSAQAIMFAHNRIHKRRIGRWRFWGHAILFVLINGAIVIFSMQPRQDPSNLLITVIWLVGFIFHALSTFPSKKRLEKRETAYGRKLQHELVYLRPEKPKVREKLKRGTYYMVGDDGELEEVEDEMPTLEDKPKRMMRDGE